MQDLEVENQRLDKLQESRLHFSPAAGAADDDLMVGSKISHNSSNDRDLRGKLAAALIHLLNLEKHDSEDSPEIVKVRQQITSLQSQIATSPTSSPSTRIASRVDRSGNRERLAQIDMDIRICDDQILGDIEKLSELTAPAKQASVAQELGTAISAQATQKSSPLETAVLSKFPFLTENRSNHSLLLLEILISLVLGFVLSISSVFIWDLFDDSIRNEADIRHALPATAVFVGTIPRMKTS